MKVNTIVQLFDDQECLSNEFITKAGLKMATMTLINSLISNGFGEKSLELKVNMRYELLTLGIQSILRKLMGYTHKQVDDEGELQFMLDETGNTIDENPQSMFETINERLKSTASYSNWISILYHLILTSNMNKIELWILIDKLIQKITSEVVDCNLLNELISKNNESDGLRKQINEQEVEINELKKKLLDFESILAEKQHIEKLLNELRQKNKLDLKEESEKSSRQIQIPNLLTPPNSPMCVSPPPPPPPLPFGLSKTPPTAPPMFALSSIQQPKRNIPASKVAMKFFNWSKIPNQNYQDTLWVNTNEESFYEILDLDEFQGTFSAYQQNYQENEPASLLNHTNSLISLNTGYTESFDEHSLAYRMSSKLKKEFSVIDNRRATNLEILLAKFKKNKLTNEQLQSIILSMDQGDELAKDMVEQLLKFVPTAEEETLLNEHEGETMAEPDRFLHDMSKIFHYRQKLECLYFKKKYSERCRELTSKIEQTTSCCQSLLENKHILTIMQLVLCMGNFMNQGHRNGTVAGFTIANLNKLIDIKSSADKSYSLMHFLIHTLEQKFPECLHIWDELNSVIEVSKINLETLQVDYKSLEAGFNQLQKELKEHQFNQSNLCKDDQFIDVVSHFNKAHSQEMFDLKAKLFLMKSTYLKTLKYFGEDAKIKCEDFFMTWTTFLNTFNEVKFELKVKKDRLAESRKKQKDFEALSQSIKLRPKSIQTDTQWRRNPSFQKEDELDMACAIESNSFSLFGTSLTKSKPKGLANRRRQDVAYPHKMTFNRERIVSNIYN